MVKLEANQAKSQLAAIAIGTPSTTATIFSCVLTSETHRHAIDPYFCAAEAAGGWQGVVICQRSANADLTFSPGGICVALHGVANAVALSPPRGGNCYATARKRGISDTTCQEVGVEWAFPDGHLKNALWALLQIRNSMFLRVGHRPGRLLAVLGEPPAGPPVQLDQLVIPQPIGDALRAPFDRLPLLDPSGANGDVLERQPVSLPQDGEHHVLFLSHPHLHLRVLGIVQVPKDDGGDRASFAVAQPRGKGRPDQFELHWVEIRSSVLPLPMDLDHRIAQLPG